MSRRARTERPQGRLRGWFVGDEPDYRRRGLWLILAFAGMAVSLGWRLLDVQVRQHATLSAAAARQHQSSVTLAAHRGRILDNRGRLLVGNVPVYDVYADPGEIPEADRGTVAAELAPVLGMGPGRVNDLLNTDGRFVYLKRHVGEDVQQRLAALNVRGIVAQPETQRAYSAGPVPGTSFAANLLGYVDGNGQGQYGVEGYYNQLLSGRAGSDSIIRDVNNNPIVLSDEQRVDPQDGRDLKLGLDSDVQYWAEQALAQGMSDAQAASGQAIVMDTKTGAIRAWADAPTYDANHYGAADLAALRDGAVADLYEPGSTMKAITFAGALNHRAITPEATINEGPVTVDGFSIGDWDGHAHGTVTMQQVLDQSLNDGAIHVMQAQGETNFYNNLLAFGIGSPTGIDLAGEANQPLPPQKRWSASTYATASFGQGIQATPVQMLAAINAIANKGVWVQPHVVDAIVDPATGQSTAITPQTRRVISPEAAATASQMMVGVVDNKDGSGFAARIPAFKGHVAGKTGTASVATGGGYHGEVITSFAGFMPAEDPQFTMLVVLSYPHENHIAKEGAFLAAPVWQRLATVMADAWRIQP